MQGDQPHWWQRRWVALAAVALAVVPLLYPAIPPLADVPGHIGGYRILAEARAGPLAQHYAQFDRGTFGYVWTVGFPSGRAKAHDVTLIWSNVRSALYRVVPLSPPRPTR